MENPFERLYTGILNIKENLRKLHLEVQELKSINNCCDDEDRYIDKRTAAKIAGVSVSSIDNWRRAKKIVPYYFDSAVRFKYAEFIEFLDNQKRVDYKS